MKNRPYPVGEPIVYGREHFEGVQWSHSTENPYRGYFKVRIAPPSNPPAYLPLHRRARHTSALLFALCGACSDSETPPTTCPHSTPEERSWICGYTHVSLNRALDNGYRVLEIFEIWHWSRWSKDMFASYMSTFLKQKIESSGWPPHCRDNPEAQKEYVDLYANREQIYIDPANMENNPGRKTGAKLFVNSLWGRLALRPIRTEVKSPFSSFSNHTFYRLILSTIVASLHD